MSEFDPRPHLVARVKALDTPLTDEEIGEIMDRLENQEYENIDRRVIWNVLGPAESLGNSGWRLCGEMADALTDELARARLDFDGSLPRIIAHMESLGLALTNEQLTRVARWIGTRRSAPGLLTNEKLRRYLFEQGISREIDSEAEDKIMSLYNVELIRPRLEIIEQDVNMDAVPQLPGLGLRLGWMPAGTTRHDLGHFPLLASDGDSSWKAVTLLNREVCMLNIIETLTNKPEWWKKCRDPEICGKWRREMLEMNWPEKLGLHRDSMTPLTADGVIAELREKATFYEKTGLVPVMDFSAAAVKSDTLLNDELTRKLKTAVSSLEDVPEDEKDWHPRSDNKVLDLVHPSLWPLVYGKSRFVPDKRIGLDEALNYTGTGIIIPKPLLSERASEMQSTRFQWLPCDVSISADGKANIESYINNLHPTHHAELYTIIETLIEKSLPAWDLVYKWPTDFRTQRLETMDVSRVCRTEDICNEADFCAETNRPLEPGEPKREAFPDEDDPDEEEHGIRLTPRRVKDLEWFERTHFASIPEPDTEKSPLRVSPRDVLSSGFFSGTSKVQVIVKLANIHLTPESPEYDGGSWHVEGMLNEHICATALFYYDNENISDSYLAFRTRGDAQSLGEELRYDQFDISGIERVFAINDLNPVQNFGRVLTRGGRALFFPNLYQHRVSPFKLADPTRPGHRKIVALFLVDPKIAIISTANVGPQQRHWWSEGERVTSEALSRLPAELRNMVLDEANGLMDFDKADDVRLELMEERSNKNENLSHEVEGEDYNFCEH